MLVLLPSASAALRLALFESIFHDEDCSATTKTSKASAVNQVIALAVSPRNGTARIQRILKNLDLPEGIPIAASITQEGRRTATHKGFAIKSSFPKSRI